MLHDSLDHAVSDVSADLPALAVASRNQGLSICRRRRALAAVGSIAAASVLAIGGYALVPGAGGGRPRRRHRCRRTRRSPDRLASGATAPITARAVAAALAASVDEVADGTVRPVPGRARQPARPSPCSCSSPPPDRARPGR